MSKDRKKDLILLFVMSLIVSIGAFYNYLTTEELKTLNKSIVFDSYYYAGNGYKTKSNFYLKSKEEKYTISSTIFPVFNYNQFKNEISKGDTLDLIVDKSSFIFQIHSKNKAYLESKNSIKNFKSNEFIGLIVGILFALISILVLGLIFKN